MSNNLNNTQTGFSVRQFLARHHPSAFLLAAQFVQLLLYTVFEGLPDERRLISAFGGLILVFVVWVVSRSAGSQWFALALAVPAFLASLLSASFPATELLIFSSLLEALLYFYTAGALIVYMMNDYKVTADELFAAGATFTLITWGFAYTYMLCDLWLSGSFISSLFEDRRLTFVELLSLSFSNMSATGLSDIMPATGPARLLTMLEQFTGVAYIAVVVSRLIGLTISNRSAVRRKSLLLDERGSDVPKEPPV